MDYIARSERLNRLVALIKRKATGTKSKLAKKLWVSRNTIDNDFRILERYDADVKWSQSRNTYYFDNPVDLDFDPRNGDSEDDSE